MSGGANVLVGAQQMDLGVGQDDADFADVLDGEFGFAVRAGDSADGAREMIAFEFFHVRHFERLEEKVVETHQSQRVGHVEPQDEGADKVGRFLNRPWTRGRRERGKLARVVGLMRKAGWMRWVDEMGG